MPNKSWAVVKCFVRPGLCALRTNVAPLGAPNYLGTTLASLYLRHEFERILDLNSILLEFRALARCIINTVDFS